MLSRMFDNYEKSEDQSRSSLMPSVKDQNGCFLIDRSPKYFDPILNYLRTGKLVKTTKLIYLLRMYISMYLLMNSSHF